MVSLDGCCADLGHSATEWRVNLEERLASVQGRLDGTLAEDVQGRVCFVQNGSVVRRWSNDPEAIEEAIRYLEYTAERLGV